MTPNYLRTPKISVSPYCDCSNSGNKKDECDRFTEFFTENTCLRKCFDALFRFPPLFSVFSASPCSAQLLSVFICSSLQVFFLLLHSRPPLSVSFSGFPLLSVSLPKPKIPHCLACIVIPESRVEKPVILHQRLNVCVCIIVCVCVCVCVPKCCSRTPVPDL